MGELAAAAQVRSFCSFRARERLLGLDISCVREVSTTLPVTPVPQAPAAVHGLVNLRSQIYLVVDPRPLLGSPALASTPEARLIILQPGAAENIAILADGGGDIIQAGPAQIESAVTSASPALEPGGNQAPAFIVGVCKLEGELLMIIDPAKLLEAIFLTRGQNRETMA
jgi:purine-binding chemotaxis protein CheW